MHRAVVVLLVVLAARPAAAEETVDRKQTLRLVVAGAGIATYALSETWLKEPLTVDLCRWCTSNPIDNAARNATVWSDPEAAHHISNGTAFVLAPIGIPLLLAASSRANFLADFIPVLEAATYSALTTQLLKMTFGRSRPFVIFRDPEIPPDVDDNTSFPSGHTTLAASIAVSAGVVAHRRGYALEPVIWAAGITLTAATGYLRMAADRHYLSDVFTGAAIGTLAGFFIPRLTGSLPISISPMTNGIVVSGEL
jgi:membrane-associated phospholipid phosphatase